jgi:hypothetical protein
MVTAEWSDITFASYPALVPGGGVVQVAPGRGAAASGGGAPGGPGGDQVLELAAGPVPGLGVPVAAGAAGDRGEPDPQAAQVVPGRGAGLAGWGPLRWAAAGVAGGVAGGAGGGALWWCGWFGAGWFGAGWFRARGRGVPAGGATVGGGGPVGVQDGHAPPGARMPGRGGDQVPGAAGVQQPEPGGLPRGARLAQAGGQRGR